MIHSTTMFNLCAAGYFFALFIYIANLVKNKASWRRFATTITALSFISQMTGMAIRWHEAGLVELQAFERSQDTVLEGLAQWVVYSQHPPWSNLYEVLVFMAGGIIFAFLLTEIKWRIRVANIFSLIFALTLLGLAGLKSDGTIDPLVPALQSWWIHIHVISSTFGYAAGSIGAIMSLLYLVKAKDNVSMHAVAGGAMLLSTGILLILGRGSMLFSTGEYRVKLLGYVGQDLQPAGKMIDGAFKTFYVASPYVGILLIITILLSLTAAISMLSLRKRSPSEIRETSMLKFFGHHIYILAFIFSSLTIGMIVFNALTITDYQLSAEITASLQHGAPAPWRLHIRSNQWDLALFSILWGGQFFILISLLFNQKVRNFLPSQERLDRGAYYLILISFALVAVVLVTGALWAHYAWGRYWGWDPKEVGALVIWLTYAIYLHARVAYGWTGVPSAVIGVLGFFVIIAGFLGVNLGWFADGLHSYGSG